MSKFVFRVFDFLNQAIYVDDLVVCGFVSGSTPHIRVGRVLEFKVTSQQYSRDNYYLRIAWLAGSRYLPSKPTLISVKPNEKCQLLKVDHGTIKSLEQIL